MRIIKFISFFAESVLIAYFIIFLGVLSSLTSVAILDILLPNYLLTSLKLVGNDLFVWFNIFWVLFLYIKYVLFNFLASDK